MNQENQNQSELVLEQVGLSVPVTDFKALKKVVGFRNAFRSLLVRWRYILRLYVLREIAIIRTLSKNFDKIPKKSFSYLIILVYDHCAILRNLLSWKERKIKSKIIINP